jgi:ribosomal protein S18 acetylase RimI-like enzyme
MSTDKINIRRATRSDLVAIVTMLADDPLGQARESSVDPLDQRYRDAFEAIDADANQLLAVVEIGDVIAGCLQLSFIPGLSRSGMWRAQIESVRIDKSFRDKGLGQVMIDWAIDQAKIRKCGLVQLTSDIQRPQAIQFYEKLGFVNSHAGMKLGLNG